MSYTIPGLPIPATSASAKDYFAFRSNSKFTPELDIHYKPQLILNYLTAGVVENISTVLSVLFPGLLLIDYKPGIGQLTVRTSQLFSLIVAVEPRNEYRSFLVRNIISYGTNSKVQIERSPVRVNSEYVLITYDTEEIPIDYRSPVAAIFILSKDTDISNLETRTKLALGSKVDYTDTIFISDTMIHIISTRKSSVKRSQTVAPVVTEHVLTYIEYAKHQLSGIVQEDHKELMFGPTSYDTWRDSITHKSVDPTSNYETLEYIGDLALKPSFVNVLMEYYPDLTEQEATNLSSQYMSKRGQGTMADQLKLRGFLRTDTKDRKQSEDVFESFFGAIYNLGERIGDGIGYRYVKGFLRNVMGAMRGYINRELGKGDPKTLLEQRIAQITRAGTRILTISQDKPTNGKATTTISIPQDYAKGLPKLVDENAEPLPIIVGTGVGMTNKESEQNAYSNAINLFNKRGLTYDFAKSKYQSNILDRFRELDRRRNEFFSKIAQRGIISYDTDSILTETSDLYRIRLVGTTSDDSKVVLGEGISGSQDKATIRAILSFIQS
jgi:dsRNA-specific ribonuclease